MEIFELQKNDIRDSLNLIWRVFEEFEAPEYSQQGIEEFKNFILYETIIEKFSKGKMKFWGCKDKENLVGVIATRDNNHISMLFVEKSYHRQGIARNLFKVVANSLERANSIVEITVNSSPYALAVYHRLGFVDTDKEQTVNGIRFTPMKYYLNDN